MGNLNTTRTVGQPREVQELQNGLTTLEGTRAGYSIAAAIREHGTTLRLGQIGKDVIAYFDPGRNEIVISEGLREASLNVLVQHEYTFLYPADWKAREIVEEGYTGTYIAGPRNRAGTYSTSFAVGVTRAAGRKPTEAAMVLLSKFRSAFSIQELGPFPTTVAGAPAVEVEIAYWMPLPLNSIHPQRTVIRERNIFFQRGDRLYELRYVASEEDYETWLGAFRALVESFACPEKPTDTVFYRPVVTAVPQHAREESPGYEAEESQSNGKPEHH